MFDYESLFIATMFNATEKNKERYFKDIQYINVPIQIVNCCGKGNKNIPG